MSIAVFGASGRLGQAFIHQATEAEFALRLHYRAKPSEQVPQESTVVVGSLNDPTAVREVLRGAEAAVVFLGHKKDARVPFCANATRVIIDTMKTLDQSRLLVVTGAMIGESQVGLSIGMRLLARGVRYMAAEGIMEDRDEQERLVRSSHLDGWTVIKPPRLTDGSRPVPVKAGPDRTVGLLSSISRTSLAEWIVQELKAPQYPQQAVYVAE